MKVFSCFVYACILYNIITVIKIFYTSVLRLLHENFLTDFKHNIMRKKSIEISKSDLFILYSLKKYLSYPGSNIPYVFYYNTQGGRRKKEETKKKFYHICITQYIYPQLYKKGIHSIFKFFFAFIYYYYKKAGGILCLFTCLKRGHPQIGVTCNTLFFHANGINDHSPIFNGRYNNHDGDDRQNNEKGSIPEGENCSTHETEKHLLSWENKNMHKGEMEKRNQGGRENFPQNESSSHEEKHDPRRYYNLQRENMLNTKYYLTKKIKSLFKKRSKIESNKLDVIYMPLTLKVEKSQQLGRDKTKCKNCMVNAGDSLFALKIREEDTPSNTVTSLYGTKSADVQIYYDYNYEHTFYVSEGNEEENTKERGKEKNNFFYSTKFSPLEWLKGKYKMIDFTKRLFLTNSGRTKEETYYQIARNYPNRINYSVRSKMGEGAFGEIWYAINVSRNFPFKDVVLKKILINRDSNRGKKGRTHIDGKEHMGGLGDHAEETAELYAMREVYFGELLKNCENISRFVEYFKEYEMDEKKDEHAYVWLVFANEGYSLSKHLFEADTNNSGMLIPSKLWWSIKRQKIGMLVLKDLIRQILNGINNAHKKKITHRDIKMENIFVSPSTPFTVRIGDWGSAVEFSNENFFFIPTENEETEGYQPPESLFGHMKNNFMRLPYYDMWAIGIVFLQFVLGTKNPLEVKDKRNEMKLKNLYAKYSTNALKEAIFLQSLSELCLTPWSHSSENLVPLHSKPPSYSYVYDKNMIINKLQHYMNNNLVNVKKESSKVIFNIITNKYNSLILLPSSPVCPDWKCVHKYKATFVHTQNYHPLDIVHKNGKKDFNQKMERNNFYKNNCNDEQFEQILQQRDPSGVGLPDPNARDLLKRLLDFDYATRITAQQALQHPWFVEV
ncbi:serine/threonine protein kinase, putative [Plasmodium ovale]|uniref:Serine/threonine protein kinase, putative n=2 Tax=Plasmodium ovale TaxID=36330 RepID=A0A1C3KV24_PLAOA|nr:serine/threonine protein kinase, putative [Plasmodium ovale]